ncbi:MAG: hypothetical protein DI546_02650 [Rhizobium sp.]|nr:MAG: hypothetical protein DI546_02650 [Rhizobium sp.]
MIGDGGEFSGQGRIVIGLRVEMMFFDTGVGLQVYYAMRNAANLVVRGVPAFIQFVRLSC